MEFNSLHQYRSSTEPFPLLEQHPRNGASLVYNGGAYPTQTRTTQSTGSSPDQQSTGWPVGDTTTQSSHPLQRHSTMFLEGHTLRDEVTVPRPLSMTAAQTYRGMALQKLQNPQGEYLPQPKMPPPVVQHPNMTQATVVQTNWMQQKTCGDFEFPNLEQDISDYSHGMLSADDDTTIIDLRQFTHFGSDNAHDMFLDPSRRMSESSYSMSSNGPLADVPSFEDVSSSDNQGPQDGDWSGFDNAPKLQQDTSVSTHTPQRDSLIRSSSRSRVSPVPNVRASPYSLESTRNKRWSTGMYPGATTPRPYQFNRYSSYYGSPLNPQNAFSSFAPESMASLQPQNYLFPSGGQFPGNGTMLFSSDQFPEVQRPLPSQGLFRLLQSNGDRMNGCASHFADLSDPPDLYSSLHEEPCNPPEEDMNPSDPELTPHEQELRFPGDFYTPRWVRGHGNKREGWCGLCKPGRWLVLKNSAFWYDKSFTHGVSAATGAAFQGPQETRRTEGNLDVWEGLCGSCGDWIALVSSKKKGTTWFRHAYKCHTHPKVKDGPKRRREIIISASRPVSTATSIGSISAPTDDSSATPTAANPQTQLTEHDVKPDPQHDPNHDTIEAEANATPISTPQLTHTQLSTPQLTHMQTPSSHHGGGGKRQSMIFDNHSMFSQLSQGFTSRLETFAEHEQELSPKSTPTDFLLKPNLSTSLLLRSMEEQPNAFSAFASSGGYQEPTAMIPLSYDPNSFFSSASSAHHQDYNVMNSSSSGLDGFPDMI